MDDPLTGYIRAKAICVFRSGRRILVATGLDPATRELFYVPLGGRIEVGEHSEAAMRREILEELGEEIEGPVLLGVLESHFTYNGNPGHEIVFVYDAQFCDRSIYERSEVGGIESDGIQFTGAWLDWTEIRPEMPPVYPAGLIDLLRSRFFSAPGT